MARRERRADRRELRRTVDQLEQRHVADLGASLAELASEAAVIARIALVENRPAMRLLEIDFDRGGPSLLASVDPASVAALASVHLPALICLRGASRRRGTWCLDLVTVTESLTVVADELVLVDGVPDVRR